MSELKENRNRLARAGFIQKQPILFSPFQQLDRRHLEAAFGEQQSLVTMDVSPTDSITTAHPAPPPTVSRITLRQTVPAPGPVTAGFDKALRILKDALQTYGGRQSETIEALHRRFADSGKDEFYSLVAGLLEIAGFRCVLTRTGVNPLRVDARIVLEADTIPIEIKSPSEEREISVKAIRQALENKIVFLSRKMFPCDPRTVTLVVGFSPPNQRSEVHELILDIEKCYNISVGIFDFRNLLALAIAKLQTGFVMDVERLKSLRGVAIVQPA